MFAVMILAVVDLIHVDATMWGLFISVLLPPVVGYVTTLNQSPAFKAGVNLVANALGAVIATVIVVGKDAIISKHTVITTFFMYVVSHTSYKDFWKSRGVTSSLVQVETPVVDSTTGAITPVVSLVPGKLASVGRVDNPAYVPKKAA